MKKKLNGLWFFLLFIYSFQAFALSELNYKSEYQEKIIPLLNQFQKKSFIGSKLVPIHYAKYTSNEQSNRCLIILPGRSEPLEKYAEVVHDLNTGSLAGEYKFFLLDHRGQGSSGRMIEKDPLDYFKGHVDQFENYSNDVKIFFDLIVNNSGCTEKNLLAHSLGAGIAVDFMQKNPEYIDRAFLSSPMLKIQTEPYSYSIARTIVLASMAGGLGNKFAIGQKTYNGERNFELNRFTNSKARYDMTMDIFDTYPQARLGGVTNRWLNEVMSGTWRLRFKYSELKIPLRVAHAGIEMYSDKSEMIKLCEEAPYCNRMYLETSKHEVLMDKDINRNRVFSELEKFFK